MKVSELIKQLEDLPGELDVIMSSDAEGNTITELWCVDYGRHWIDGGEMFFDEWDENGDPVAIKDATAVSLWPV